MSRLSDFLGGGKPKLITPYYSGTGTYVPTTDMARCLVRVQGGGGGGTANVGYSAGSGGGAGCYVEAMLRIPIAGIAWLVGAGGAGSGSSAAPGGLSYVGQILAPGGGGGYYAASSSYWGGLGGTLGQGSWWNNVNTVFTIPAGMCFFVSGGSGGAGQCGQLGGAIGSPFGYQISGGTSQRTVQDYTTGRAVGAVNYPGGGDSYMGIGGSGSNVGNAGNGNGYGSGGGASSVSGAVGGNGAPGYIEIWDFGA